jgi:glycosyltransferase involved in cell wall biosynthesis
MKSLHVYPSPIVNESRMQRLADCLIESGLASQVVLLGLRKGELPALEATRTAGVSIERAGSVKARASRWPWVKLYRIASLYLALLRAALRARADVVHVHSLAMLPLGCIVKLLKGCRLVYDTHELETETAALARKPWLRPVMRAIERLCISYADAVVVVNESIASWYRERYGLDQVTSVMNLPELRKPVPRDGRLRAALGISAERRIFVYAGLLSHGRGIEVCLEAFEGLQDRDVDLVFMGYGELQAMVEAHANRHGRIHFLPAVPPDQVLSYLADADFGLCVIEPISLSYHFAAPNKLFEYLTAGLPVLCSAGPEMKAIVEQHRIGEAVERIDTASVGAAMQRLLRAPREQYSQGLEQAAGRYRWDAEKLKYQQAMSGLYEAGRKGWAT